MEVNGHHSYRHSYLQRDDFCIPDCDWDLGSDAVVTDTLKWIPRVRCNRIRCTGYKKPFSHSALGKTTDERESSAPWGCEDNACLSRTTDNGQRARGCLALRRQLPRLGVAATMMQTPTAVEAPP